MPISTSSPTWSSFPSFASVFGGSSPAPAARSSSNNFPLVHTKNNSAPSNGAGVATGTVSSTSSGLAPFSGRPSTGHSEKRFVPSHQRHFSSTSSIDRRDSASMFGSFSSSPSTTASTVGSHLVDPSPRPSPDILAIQTKQPSPSPTVVPSQRSSPARRPTPLMESRSSADTSGRNGSSSTLQGSASSSSFPTLATVDRSESPNKRMRNTKNLSVNTSASQRSSTTSLNKIAAQSTCTQQCKDSAPALGTAVPTVSLERSDHQSLSSSAPPTPGFIVPHQPPRKKPSNLGLTLTMATSSPDSTTTAHPNPHLQQKRPSLTLQTPADRRAPKSSLLQLPANFAFDPSRSPGHPPVGGMQLPSTDMSSATNSSSTSSSNSRNPFLEVHSVPVPAAISQSSPSSIRKQTLEHVIDEKAYDAPLSQEIKSPAYPNGPVCIYDPNIYLYLEPNDAEARKFDVVLNVAREVKSPFVTQAQTDIAGAGTKVAGVETQGRAGYFDQATQTRALPSSVDKAVQVSFDGTDRNDVVESQESLEVEHDFQSIPKATFGNPFAKKDHHPDAHITTHNSPEYIHVPWDHNTNVVDDLLSLCRLIDARTQQGKSVLVHCQCGVSRSASLLVAYGLYKSPEKSVQEAYDAVKTRSRWIGPNMNLIYQLSEFKGLLSKSISKSKQHNLHPHQRQPQTRAIRENALFAREQLRTLSLCQVSGSGTGLNTGSGFGSDNGDHNTDLTELSLQGQGPQPERRRANRPRAMTRPEAPDWSRADDIFSSPFASTSQRPDVPMAGPHEAGTPPKHIASHERMGDDQKRNLVETQGSISDGAPTDMALTDMAPQSHNLKIRGRTTESENEIISPTTQTSNPVDHWLAVPRDQQTINPAVGHEQSQSKSTVIDHDMIHHPVSLFSPSHRRDLPAVQDSALQNDARNSVIQNDMHLSSALEFSKTVDSTKHDHDHDHISTMADQFEHMRARSPLSAVSPNTYADANIKQHQIL